MIIVKCDNCQKELRNGPDNANPKANGEKRVSLKMHVEGTQSYPIDMDLCVNCAKKIVHLMHENPV